MKGGQGELHSAFARHALPGRGYVPLPVCLRVIRHTAAYDSLHPPFPVLADLLHALRRLSGVSREAVRGYWAPTSPLADFHGAQGWVELVLKDGPVIALVPPLPSRIPARSYQAFIQKTAQSCFLEWAQKVR